jgi:hypothetical protein
MISERTQKIIIDNDTAILQALKKMVELIVRLQLVVEEI